MTSTHWNEVYISSGTIIKKLDRTYLASCSIDELLNLKKVMKNLNDDMQKSIQCIKLDGYYESDCI